MNFSNPLGRFWILFISLVAVQIPLSWAQLPPAGQTPSPAPAQLPTVRPVQPQRPAPIVRQIEIQYAGPATLSRQRILSNMKTTVGQPYSELTVEDDVRALYAEDFG
jgi:outer membrane protein assembly factor BamA